MILWIEIQLESEKSEPNKQLKSTNIFNQLAAAIQ